MKQLKNLRVNSLLDNEEMKKIRGGITCYIYDTSSGSGAVNVGSCSSPDKTTCNNTCNQHYAYSGLTCICY